MNFHGATFTFDDDVFHLILRVALLQGLLGKLGGGVYQLTAVQFRLMADGVFGQVRINSGSVARVYPLKLQGRVPEPDRDVQIRQDV